MDPRTLTVESSMQVVRCHSVTLFCLDSANLVDLCLFIHNLITFTSEILSIKKAPI